MKVSKAYEKAYKETIDAELKSLRYYIAPTKAGENYYNTVKKRVTGTKFNVRK